MNFTLMKYLKRINKVNIYKLIIFLPLLIYLGERSLIAYDEGFYALQAKWILNNENWVMPMWWGDISLDRTIGNQALIAFSQKIFGQSNFSIYIPNLVASSFMLFFTYDLHKILFDKKYSIVSPIILSTTFLWINYSHLATQDMIFSSFITLGLYSSIKFQQDRKKIFLLTSGLWIGFAFMMKTYLTIIPFLAILPFLISTKILFKKLFWIGFIIGFIPFLIWSFKVISIYDFSIYSGLYKKLIYLSEENPFSNPISYYLWNIPINIFPWSAFALIGTLSSIKSKNFIERYILFFFPLINILLLSLFSTKTPYYPLPILSLISLNTYKGLVNTLNNKTIISKLIKNFNFYFIPIFLILLVFYLNSNFSKFIINSNDELFIYSGIILFSTAWLCIGFFKSIRNKIIFTLLGPYLVTSIIVQSGTLSDRSKELRIATENIIEAENLNNKAVEVIKSDINSTNAHSKIIKISLLMPNIGNGLKDISELNLHQYAWVTNSNINFNDKNQVKIIDDSKIFSPWKLVLKEN